MATDVGPSRGINAFQSRAVGGKAPRWYSTGMCEGLTEFVAQPRDVLFVVDHVIAFVIHKPENRQPVSHMGSTAEAVGAPGYPTLNTFITSSPR